MAVKAIAHKRIIKKRIKKFVRCESEDFPNKLKASWRRPRGIDNATRRRFRGTRPMAKIGYGSDKATRHLLPSGFKKFLIRNEKELEILLMNNATHAGEIASSVSARKKANIVKRAAELGVRITNPKGKVRVVEKKAA
jgi:large subunit ribosomal protein L32e